MKSKEMLALIGAAGTLGFVAGAEAGFFLKKFGDLGLLPWQTGHPEPMNDSSTLVDNGSLTPIDKLSPISSPTREPSPTKEIIKLPANPFHIRNIDFEGKNNRPAPPVFFITQLPDGTALKSYVFPKALSKEDDFKKVFDWRQPRNISFLNITGKKDSYFQGFVIQTGHSGHSKEAGDLPFESMRKALEENGRPFTKEELAKTISNFKSGQGVLFQGNLAQNATPEMVDAKGENLVNPIRVPAKIKAIIRLNPEQIAKYNDAEASGRIINIMDFVDEDEKVNVDGNSDVTVEFCGWKLFAGETKPLNVPYYQATRYLVIYSD